MNNQTHNTNASLVSTTRMVSAHLSEALIKVSQRNGAYTVSTWLPAGMNWSETLPEYVDRGSVDEARTAWKRRVRQLQQMGFSLQ